MSRVQQSTRPSPDIWQRQRLFTRENTRNNIKKHTGESRQTPTATCPGPPPSLACGVVWRAETRRGRSHCTQTHCDLFSSSARFTTHLRMNDEEGARACAREVVTRPATLTVTLRSVAAVPVPTGASRKKEGPAAASAQAAGRGQGPEKILSSAQHVRSGTGTTRTDFSTSVQPPVALYSLTATSPTAKALSQL